MKPNQVVQTTEDDRTFLGLPSEPGGIHNPERYVKLHWHGFETLGFCLPIYWGCPVPTELVGF